MNFAVLFDMDGVIVDSNPFHKIAFEQFLARYQISLTDEQLKVHVYGKTNKEAMPYIFKKGLSPTELDERAEEKEAMFREIYKQDIQPLEGLVPFLQMLKVQGIPTTEALL
jgi:beta-phosphoglucomutase-like phosphatase (HAD superfamily)